MGDDACDDMGHGAWMTYDELATSRAITRRAAVRLTQRQRLRRQPGNDGLVRIWVPASTRLPSQGQSHRDDGGDDARDTGLMAGALATLEAAVAALTGRAEADRRVEQAEARADVEQARADSLKERLETTERQMTQAEKDRDMAIAAHDRIAREAETLRQADLARRAAGRLARIKAAWRGE
jgi:hypothetical protein